MIHSSLFWLEELHDPQCTRKNVRLDNLNLDLFSQRRALPALFRQLILQLLQRYRQFSAYSHPFYGFDVVVLEEQD